MQIAFYACPERVPHVFHACSTRVPHVFHTCSTVFYRIFSLGGSSSFLFNNENNLIIVPTQKRELCGKRQWNTCGTRVEHVWNTCGTRVEHVRDTWRRRCWPDRPNLHGIHVVEATVLQKHFVLSRGWLELWLQPPPRSFPIPGGGWSFGSSPPQTSRYP